jgi:hypothetical protein
MFCARGQSSVLLCAIHQTDAESKAYDPSDLFERGIMGLILATFPICLLVAVFAPDLSAKVHLIELPLYVAAASCLISSLGIRGAAIVWTLRMVLDFLLMLWLAARLRLLCDQLAMAFDSDGAAVSVGRENALALTCSM